MKALLKDFLRKFLSGTKEWFADVADHYRLWAIESKLDSLNEELDWETGSKRHETIVLLDIYSDAHNEIWRRVQARDMRHHRHAVAH